MRIVLCVTNDIVTDRRINRIAWSLLKLPAKVLIIGRAFKDNLRMPDCNYRVRRMNILFRKGPLFYAEYNLRLFFLLLVTKADVLVANDLDVLPAVYLASRIRRLPVVYDSHEYFTEVPELVGRKKVKKIWEGIESAILPRIKHTYTVSPSIAGEYNRKYGTNMMVIRNLPFRMENHQPSFRLRKGKEYLILYQGSLNMGRGLELAIQSMQYMQNTRLIIAGTGDLEKVLMRLADSLALAEVIQFTGRVYPELLWHYTLQADLGISLEEDLGLNYRFALPNKLFDYVQAHVPVLVSDLPEMASLVREYGIGSVTHTRNPLELAREFTIMLTDTAKRQEWQSNLGKAAGILCWENEESNLIEIYRRIGKTRSDRW
jgi:glycosyltransferase involved in cell wall biosynthesis